MTMNTSYSKVNYHICTSTRKRQSARNLTT